MIKKLIRLLFTSDDDAKAEAPKNRRKTYRPGTEPVSYSSRQHGIDPGLVSPNAVRVTRTLQEAGFKAYIVGGAVRDLLLGIRPKDFDVATNATPEEIVKLFRRS